MKIGIFDPYLDSLGGGERYALTLAENLSQDNRVEIFWNDPTIKNKIKDRLFLNLDKAIFVDNIFTRETNLLKRLIKTRYYDLIFFLSDGSIPTTLAQHNILHFQRPFPHVSGNSFLNKIKLARYQAVVCNSAFTKKYIDREYGVEAQVIYPPVDIRQFHPLEKHDFIVSVGRFSKNHGNKKQKEMVECFGKMQKTLSNWKLCLIGGLLEQDREYFSEVEELAKDLPVKLLPNEPFINLQAYYGQAKIYWHAAGFGEDEKINPADMEHFGISTVEAMAAGCVPIVYNNGGQREIIEPGLDGFLWNNEEELMKYTQAIVSDEDLRRGMAQKAIKKSQKFSTQRFIDEFKKLMGKF